MDKQYQIPSSVASKLEQIKLYMGMHSVTAFVGAGFSMNAEIPNNVSMKTWAQLREVFLEKLYPNNEEEQKKDGNDVVRLSSLVDAQFGHNELDNILEEALPDKLIRPGKLHRLLVQLPWKDILTTNYDTLIERAAEQVINGFKLVTNKETLLYQPSPRIIKLHGSFPNIRPYIMTQEDYRRYPIERPEMVNTAKQCFLESLVCLIGFSGEDPNFRAWIGWLKDVIGQQRLCPTYLITYRKGFHDAEKALLSKLGIDIINLAEVGGVDDYYSAYEFFLNYLKELPSQWNGSVKFESLMGNDMDDEKFKEYVTEKIKTMQAVRKSYPGWLFLPKAHEKDFEDANSDIVYMEQCYKRITDDMTKLRFLFEINWRLRISATPQKLDWLFDALEYFADRLDTLSSEDKKLMPDLLLSLMEILRYEGEDEKFLQLCDKLLAEKGTVPERHIYYQQVLYWLARFDHQKVKELLSKWTVDVCDYPNCLQKANILYFVGEHLEAYQLLTKCKEMICKSLLQNKEDIYAKSCLTHILTTIRWCKRDTQLKNESASDTDLIKKFAIGETFDEYTERLSGKAYEERPVHGFVREHLFEIGNYTNSWNIGPSGFVADYLYPCKWWMLKERIGCPMFMFSQSFTKYCIQNMFSYSWSMAWMMMMLSASSKIVENVFGREQLSSISEETANEYFDNYIALFEKADVLGDSWVSLKVLNILPTILGRLCTKVSQDRTLRFVKAALKKWKPAFVNKVLKCAYDCLDNKNLTVIWELLLTDKVVDTHYGNNGYTFPDRYMLNFVITDSIKNRIVDGLKSDDKENVLLSVFLMEVIWHRPELTDEDKDKISNAVREQRSRENAISESIYTYTYIDLSDDERDAFQNKLDDDIKTFCNTNYQFEHNSEPLSEWYSLMDRINILRKYLSEEQKKTVLLHCYDLIELNKTIFEKNDGQDIFGGMRQFTQKIVTAYQSLFLNVALDIWTDDEKEKIGKQIDWLRFKEYRCLPMKVKAFMQQHLNNNGEIMGAIKSSLFSKKQDVQVEGINALFTMKENGGDVSEILHYIFENFRLADPTVYKQLLILFVNLIVRDYNENDFHQHIMDFLTNIHQDCENYGLDVCALSDLQHYTNYVAGALSVKAPNENIPVFTKEESGFNDVFVGFDKGVESALRKIN